MVNFLEAAKDVIQNDTEYKKDNSDCGIRRNNLKEIDFFYTNNLINNVHQEINFSDLNANWTKIEVIPEHCLSKQIVKEVIRQLKMDDEELKKNNYKPEYNYPLISLEKQLELDKDE